MKILVGSNDKVGSLYVDWSKTITVDMHESFPDSWKQLSNAHGVGYSTPIWIKYPFMKLTSQNKNAKYVIIDKGYNFIPKEIEKQSIFINENINNII